MSGIKKKGEKEKRGKGEKPGLSSAPGFSSEAQGNNLYILPNPSLITEPVKTA
jgi:hypothetical protein